MQLRPLQDRIIVRPIAANSETKSGIIIPDTAQEKPVTGTVLAVGPGRYESGSLVPVGVNVGDTVLYGIYSGTSAEHDGEKLIFMREADVFAVIGKEGE